MKVKTNLKDDLAAFLYNQEIKLLDREFRKSFDQINSILSEDFIEIGSSGRIYNKRQIIDALSEESPDYIYKLENYRIIRLSFEIVLTNYEILKIRDNDPAIRSVRSSIWKLNEGKWRLYFHQGTLFQTK